MGYWRRIFLFQTTYRQTNQNCNRSIQISNHPFRTVPARPTRCFGLQRAKNKHTRIIKSYRRREGSRKFTNGGGENSEDHGVRISRYLYSKNRIHRTERKELKIGLSDREIAHGFGSLAIYEQRFSVFSAG